MKTHAIKILSAFLLLALTACQKSDLNDLQEAQACLDTASAANARGCVSKISSDSSPEASGLKCAAIFISEGFGTAASFVNAIESINNGGGCTGGCSSTINALNTLNFKSAGVATLTERNANVATAAEAFTVCSLANVKFYTQISSLFKIGTDLSMLAYGAGIGGASPTEDELKAQINNMNNENLGTLVSSTYTAACTDLSGASDATKKYCAELGGAIASFTNPVDIGACLKKKLINPNDTCP